MIEPLRVASALAQSARTCSHDCTVTVTVCAAHAPAAHSSRAGATKTEPLALSPIVTLSAAAGARAPSMTAKVAAAPDRLALTAAAPAAISRTG